jgi:hypothetical protein
MTGPYWAVRWAEYLNRSAHAKEAQASFELPKRQFMLAGGVQRRMFGHGFYDFSISAGWGQQQSGQPRYTQDPSTYYPYITGWNERQVGQLTAQSEIRLGFGLSALKSAESVEQCSVFRCLEEETQLLKLDLSKLFYFAPNRAMARLSTAFERKINTSAWSLNQEFLADYEYWYYTSSDSYGGLSIRQSGLTARYILEPRYYYSLSKRMRQGRSANNLSGIYVGLQSSNTLSYSFLYLNGQPLSPEFVTALGAVWGIQKRIFDRGFFDAKIGLARNLNKKFHDFLLPGVNPVLGVKIGWAMSR